MDGWLILAAGCAIVALVFFLLWRSALRAQAEAERLTGQAGRAAKETQVTSARQSAFLAALQLAQTDAAILLSPERIVLEWNQVAQTLFGPPGAPGQTLISATRSLDLDQLAERALAGETDCDQQIVLGAERTPYRARAIRAGQFGAVLVLQDLSMLQRLGRARRDFVANISHELRTPLTSIRLLVESLQSGVVQSPGDVSGGLQKIDTEVRSLQQMAQELLDLAQIESGESIVKLVPTPLAPLAAEIVERLESQARIKQQSIEVAVGSELVVL